MKKLIIFMLAASAGALIGCSSDNDNGPHPTKPTEPTWRCTVGEREQCYTGPAGTQGKGICVAGHRDCIDDGNGSQWTDCIDEVTPDYSYPCDANAPDRDNDCNGIADSEQDEDGDGLTVCDRYGRRLDCCDNDKQCITPGARSFKRSKFKDCIGDFIDGDCNGVIDDGDTECTDEDIRIARAERCGDGMLQSLENCDEGLNGKGGTGEYNGCNEDCTWASYCGDGKVDTENGEECDDGLGRIMVGNESRGGGTGAYNKTSVTCGPDCKFSKSGYCGDGIINGDEQCDYGKDRNTGEYGGCNPDCTFGPYCGDNKVNGNEICDDGLGHIVDTNSSIVGGGTGAYGGVACLPDCTSRSSYCGDGILDPGEICDEGSKNTESTYGTCQKDTCVWNSICGDGIIDAENGEQCDDGIVTEERDGNIVKLKYVGGDGSYEGCTENCKLAPRCGDGIVNSIFEECDKGKNGDASCSPTCMIEPGYECKNNECHQLKCGNNVIDPGEECDDKKDAAFCIGCVAKSGYACKNSNPPCPTNIPGKYCAVSGVECIKISDLYGDGIVSRGFEECDDGNTIDYDGCTRGNVDPGYTCLTPGARCYARTCGDGILAYGEECDDGNANSNDGCSNRCKLEEGFRCETVGKKSVCKRGNGCGDGIVQHGEECDDGGQNGGCSSTCKIEPGYECPSTGGTCRKVTCGNGVVNQSTGYNTYEQCDLGTNNGKSGTGCTSTCRIAQGYHCNETGTQCYSGVCGDGNIDIGEDCDDGNLISGDGCNAACKIETVFEQTVDGSYKPICGDGITVWDAGEECDDGNLVSGDGCSAQCTIETGWQCTEHSDTYPSKIQLPVTYRDFRAYFTTYNSNNSGTKNSSCTNAKNSTVVDGCINGTMAATYGDNFKAQAGHPDFERMNVNADGAGLVKNRLGSDGLPVWQKDTKGTGITAKSFNMWYRDYPGINKTVKQNLTLTLTNATNGTYKFESSAFFPLDGKGYGNETVNGANAHNFHFTSHIKTYFKFRGNNETLDFTGDDDVFVFVNGIQAIDLGGCHSATNKSFKLDSTTQRKTVNNQTYTYKYNNTYDLYENGIYAINFFQAERKTSGSNFKLTLAGFMDMGPSTCNTVCGDGILAGYEQCESTDANGNLLAISEGGRLRNGCTANCTNSSCGNEQLDSWEECDYVGPNPKYRNVSYEGNFSCNANTCRVQYCGDGIVDLLLGEECDAGSKNGGAECTKNCELPRCGDGITTKELGEECDDGPNNQANAYGEGKCTNECKRAPYCGDGNVDPGEECDLGHANKAGAYGEGTCTTDCKWGGYCGDGIKDAREKCDNGQANNDTLYNGCTTDCTFGPRCGDGIVNGSEICDNGAANSEFVYGINGCRPDCTLAPYCGDGIINGPEKREYCDNGPNNNAAAYGESSCTDNCMKGARCGDGVVNGSEECDNGSANSDNAYNGCTTNCELGPRCGDGIINGNEFCDNGSRNSDSIYGTDECKTNCTRAPYCGDGLLNGTAEHPELCDLGKDNNIGNYNGCTSDCQLGPHCGDGIIQPEDGEECDPMQEGEMYCTSTCRKIQL